MLYHMEGAATPWRTDYIKRHISGNNQLSFTTFEEFILEADGAFLPWNYMEEQLRALHNLKQLNRPVDHYISQFRVLVAQAGMVNPGELIHQFRKGLDYEIGRRTIERAPNNTLEDWINAARTAESMFRMEMDYRRSHGKLKSYGNIPQRQNYQTNHQNRSQTPRRQGDPYAMDVDAMEAALNNFAISEGYEENDEENINETEVDDSEEPDINELVSQRVSTVLNEILTPQQKQDLKAKKCFNCGKNGHYAKNCRLPKKTFSRPAINKTNQNKRPVAPPKFQGDRNKWKKQQFQRINEVIQEMDDDEEVAELCAQHLNNESATSSNVVDFAFDD